MYYFQELPPTIQKEVVQKLFKRFRKIEIVNDYINRHNWQRTQKDWLKMEGRE